ncbi:putative E3 ubiquitin-protein ligase HERC6 [Discoglossus pictus]
MYCWGDNWCGQLGLDEEERGEVHFTENDFFQGKASVQKAVCGKKHSLFLLEDGTIFSCGCNKSGQLGRKNNSSNLDQIHALEAQTIIDVSCGHDHSVAVCSQGNVYSWGDGSEGQLGNGQFMKQCVSPKRITELSKIKIIQIACGHFHSIALSEDGKVFSWGQNSAGQLGLGKQIPNQARPQLVTSLKGIPLAQVTAGGSQSFALSMSGTVFGWGKNNAGQLGFKTKSNAAMFKPYAVSSLRNLGVVFISCGDEHTAVLTKDGSVYTFGDGAYGQLGQSSVTQTSVPKKIEEFEGKISQVSCGSYHTLVYVYTTNSIVSFGHGSQRQQENAASAEQAQALQKQMTFNISTLVSSKDLQDINVKCIFAGNYVSFANSSLQPQLSEKSVQADNLQKILRLDRSLIQKWLKAKTGSGDFQEAKRTMSTVFSSASCITASFIKDSTTKPHQVVDLEVASKLFEELSKDKRFSAIICSSLKTDLFPDLESLPPLYEALSVFLLLPECLVMHDPNVCLSVVVPFANAINNLSKNALEILEALWKFLQAQSFIKQVQIIKNALVLAVLGNHLKSDIKSLLHAMEKLYKANKKANYIVPKNTFCTEQICRSIIVPLDLNNWYIWKSQSNDDENALPVIYCRFPFIFDYEIKIQYLCFDFDYAKTNVHIAAQCEIQANRMKGSSELPKFPYCLLKVRRSHLVEDTLHKLSIVDDSDLKKQLLVAFQGEEEEVYINEAEKQFFLFVFEEMCNPDYGLFVRSEPFLPVWFPSSPSADKKKYFYFGILLGLAISNKRYVYFPFPLALFKKLLGKKVTLEDLKELQPTIGRSLQNLLDYENDVVENLEVYFSLSWENKTVDLIPNGTSVCVNNSNKRDYVNKCVDYIFNSSVKEIIEEFKRGFYKVCETYIISFFHPDELRDIMSGTTNYDWDIFEKHTVYLGNYNKDHPTIKLFWKVFHSLTLEQKKGFLFFLTGNDRVLGQVMHQYKMMISRFGVTDETYLPEAQTCNHMLFLPEYSNTKILREKLLLAIENNRGYHKD